jgi:oligogalacturonide lyase
MSRVRICNPAVHRPQDAYGLLPARVRPGGGATIFAADIDTGKVRKIATVDRGFIGSINADETLLLGQWAGNDKPLQPNATGRQQQVRPGQYASQRARRPPLTFAEAKEVRMNDRLEARIPMEIFTIDIKTGARKVVVTVSTRLAEPYPVLADRSAADHVLPRGPVAQGRPDLDDPHRRHRQHLIHKPHHEHGDRRPRVLLARRQVDLVRSADPARPSFWVAGYDLATGKRRWYHLERNEWSVHYNQSPDLTLFSGDGGDSEMVAHAPGREISLFVHAQRHPDVAGIHAPGAENLISPGTFNAEKLVDMRKQDYRLEPNMTFTPDGKWIVFRANMEGANHVYAVEMAKAQ